MAARAPLPTSNLTFNDIKDTLNIVNTGNVTDEIASAFKSTAKINIWSKHKPIHRPEAFVQDFDPTKPNYVKDWWKGIDGNCGLVPYKVASPAALVGYANGTLNGWTHQLPTGGAGSPYRLGDFADYYATSLGIISGVSLNSAKVENNTNSTLTMSIIKQSPEMYTRSLSFDDFPTLKNYYLGLFATNGTQNHFVTSDTTVGDGATFVSLKTTGWTTGSNWKAYLCLAEKKHSQDAQYTGMFYTIPYMSAKSFEVVSSLATIVANILRPQGSNTLNVTIYVTYPSARTFDNNNLYIKMPSNTNEQPGLQDTAKEQIVSIPSFSVTANTQELAYRGTVTLNSHLAAQTSPLKWVVSLGGGAFSKAGTVIHTSPLPS